jgi:hypothetical protein
LSFFQELNTWPIAGENGECIFMIENRSMLAVAASVVSARKNSRLVIESPPFPSIALFSKVKLFRRGSKPQIFKVKSKVF